MRLVLDLQASQTAGSRFRGIGRYSMALATAMLRQARGHECWIALNGAFPESVEAIRKEFATLVPPERIRVWNAIGPVAACDPAHAMRRRLAEVLREDFLRKLQPDMLHVSSLFEGLEDDAVTSVGGDGSPASAVTLYDLIPLIYRDIYLGNPIVRDWYQDKLASLHRARLLLAISESSRREAIDYLQLPAASVVNISSAADPMFRPLQLSMDTELALRAKFGLHGPFVMYTGGIDHRKNIDGLIRAFAMLPSVVRDQHQLAIVCSVQAEERSRLESLALSIGLHTDQLVMTGFVTDQELVALCNLCKLFVFPSWHEGFGLPALEAMACGAPVIAANTSSLPEVIGREDALFDPRNDSRMAAAMHQALTDESFRLDLAAHGPQRASLFSWQETARRALGAMEADFASRHARGTAVSFTKARPRLAFVSPLPPERSGIADYSAELLPALAKYYEIEVITDQPAIDGAVVASRFPKRSVEWFAVNAGRYQRVVYQFGNSPFHGHMFELARDIPGVIVLHDFYLGHILRHLDAGGEIPSLWDQALFQSHGYRALAERYQSVDSEAFVSRYPCSGSVIAAANGVIVHSGFCEALISSWYGGSATKCIRHIPHMRQPVRGAIDRAGSRMRLGIADDAFVVATFGIINPHKQAHRLIDAWVSSGLASRGHGVLLLVGEAHDPAYAKALKRRIAAAGMGASAIRITGFVESADYQRYLQAADVAVQLRTDTRGETSGAMLDCLAYGVPVVINAHGSAAELPDGVVHKLADDFTDAELSAALEALWQEADLREGLSRAGVRHVATALSPEHAAELYRDAIEHFQQTGPRTRLAGLVRQVADATTDLALSESQLREMAAIMARYQPLGSIQKQLLVDISVLVITDAKSGIQRVVRSVLGELLANPPAGYRVEPVYADGSGVYRYARRFTCAFLGIPLAPSPDEPIEVGPGDIFLGLDLAAHIVPGMADYFREMRKAGVRVHFVLYDLLPALQPQWFPSDLSAHLQRWYAAIGELSDSVIAISRAVAVEYGEWLDINQPGRSDSLRIDYFHLGSDIEASAPTWGLDEKTRGEIASLADRPSWLMVGTVEPRKGHAQALDAFEQLWAEGVDVALVVVGKRGWRVDELANRLSSHAELGRRLFWFEGISDEALEAIYGNVSMLLAASLGEGFGLPLVEAARHRLPVLARDIPVFREVAGAGAMYFVADSADRLADALRDAMERLQGDRCPDPQAIEVLSWAQSTKHLLRSIDGDFEVLTWQPGKRFLFPAGHPQLHSQVASPDDGVLSTTSMNGYLVFGPYLALPAGNYTLRLLGSVENRSRANFDVVAERGEKELIAVSTLQHEMSPGVIAEQELFLERDVQDMEVRLWADAEARLHFKALEIQVADVSITPLPMPTLESVI